jgi:hypothetical protein
MGRARHSGVRYSRFGGCCTVSSDPMFQSIRHASMLFPVRQHLFQSGLVSSRYLLPG